ncbi:hypothetical protein C8A00DRAFT_12332, partial [Chaetomidium leptoderma]
FLSNSEIKINQERIPRGVVVMFINHKIVDRDISIENARPIQGFVPINTAFERSKQRR